MGDRSSGRERAQPAIVIASSRRTVISSRCAGWPDSRVADMECFLSLLRGPLPVRQRAVRLRRTRNTYAPSEGFMG